jgi:hypothetical protein
LLIAGIAPISPTISTTALPPSIVTGWDAVLAFQAWSGCLPSRLPKRIGQIRRTLVWSSDGAGIGYPGDVLAFATFPNDGGDIIFDDAEPWTAFGNGDFDLYLSLHELGHALGLDHSSDLMR